jgi:surfeit locus 1 family protein
VSRTLPVIPTLIVAAAVALMIALGVWQLGRAREKDSFQALARANVHAPPIALPRTLTSQKLLFRRATAFCLQPTAIRLQGAGANGFRAIAQCRTGAEGPGFAVQLGSTRDPRAKVAWDGGKVRGYLAKEPDSRPFWTRWFDRQPAKLMIVSETPAPGLAANEAADPSVMVNNSRSYAVQWFLFAAVAAVIYLLALRASLRKETA